MPKWLTFPYDVSICRGEAVINEYLSEERERYIPEGGRAEKVFHQESQSYYRMFDDYAWMQED